MPLYQVAIVAVPVAIIAAYSRSNFAIGGFIEIALFTQVNLRWIIVAKKKMPVSPGPSSV